ncbi:hypothetical protein PINS_up008933 [Pythium insidiosum]|nr:hypothetical protein PINS_up008933 [Pythium insidiosum]
MKVFPGAAILLGIGLLAPSSTASRATLVKFNENLLASTPEAARRFVFQASEVEPLRANVLGATEYYEEPSVQCAVTNTTTNSGSATVVLAISKCLDDKAIGMVKAWVDQVKADKVLYFKENEHLDITFSTTLIPGQCEAREQRYFKESGEEDADLLLADSDRIAAFAEFGQVLESLPEPNGQEAVPVAVISVTDDNTSFKHVEQYERRLKVSNSFNFKICQEGKSCSGEFKNCIELSEVVDLFMFNPFTVERSFECANVLHDSVPVSYIDGKGSRQCVCTCPVGTELVRDAYGGGSCLEIAKDTCPCSWSSVPYGFKIHNTEPTCFFSNIASKWGVPAPFPSDNYVADRRTNLGRDDDVSASLPVIAVSKSTQATVVYDAEMLRRLYVVTGQESKFPPTIEELYDSYGFGEFLPEGAIQRKVDNGEKETVEFAWRDYQISREAKIDEIAFTAYGKYTLELTASDYSDKATCMGCIAITDEYRPRATTTCPVGFCDNTTSLCDGHEASTSTLTPENLAEASKRVDQVYQYQRDAKNDGCSEDRCDLEGHWRKDFFETDYAERNYGKEGKTCFDGEEIERDFLSNPNSKQNPLAEQTEYGLVAKQEKTPVREGVCTRCCKYETKLREFWTDYTCGYEYDIRQCDGLDSESCGFQQCLTLFGDTMAAASASIRPEITSESEKVIKGLPEQGYQTFTQIHRALECSKFGGSDGVCTYSAKLSDLLVTDQKSRAETKADLNAEEFVFWRYKIKGDKEGWRLYDPKDSSKLVTHVFDRAETKITVEAWTACGIVRKFYFYVHLHPHSEVKVCDQFSKMWYQSTVSRLSVSSDLCTYPGSDFAELTFDYHPNIGLRYARTDLRMSIADVKCEAKYQDRSSSATLLHVSSGSFETVERFAFELLNREKTAPATAVNVTCHFTYARAAGGQVTHTCNTAFTIRDCDAPQIDHPDALCEFETCAGEAAPGPFEACGGRIVRATDTDTIVSTLEDVECCQACSQPTVCKPLLGLTGASSDLKRCEPQGVGAYGDLEDMPVVIDEPAPTPYYAGPVEDETEYATSSPPVYAPSDNYAPPPEYRDAPEGGAAAPADGAVATPPEAVWSLLASARAQATTDNVAAVGAVGAALVAVVALVAAHRRAPAATMEEDPYYALLE